MASKKPLSDRKRGSRPPVPSRLTPRARPVRDHERTPAIDIWRAEHGVHPFLLSTDIRAFATKFYRLHHHQAVWWIQPKMIGSLRGRRPLRGCQSSATSLEIRPNEDGRDCRYPRKFNDKSQANLLASPSNTWKDWPNWARRRSLLYCK